MWAQAHAPVWAANAANIGLTPAQAAAYSGAVAAYEAAALAQEQARQAARAATDSAAAAFNELRSLTGDRVRNIRAFAQDQEKPLTVYMLAQIPPPAAPTPVPPPAKPADLAALLDASTGELTITWKAANPRGASGTSYIVKRKLPGEAQFAFVGVSGSKRFTDETLFAGPDSVQYTVQGQRADASGPVSDVFTVNFGRGGGGLMITSAFEGSEQKAA
jgi:hypothetical protein